MALICLKCPQCSGDLSIEEGRDVYHCPYCGSKVMNSNQQIITNNYYGNGSFDSADKYFERWVNTLLSNPQGITDHSVSRRFCNLYFDDPRVELVNFYENNNSICTQINDNLLQIPADSQSVKDYVEEHNILSFEKMDTIDVVPLERWKEIILFSVADEDLKSRLLEYVSEKIKLVDDCNRRVEAYNLLAEKAIKKYAKVSEKKARKKDFGKFIVRILVVAVIVVTIILLTVPKH